MSKRAPILVTGVPRSGTTWLARVFSNASGAALAGREPMNPRAHQYGLGGTLSGWARLSVLSARQDRLLRTSYRGLNPFVYSRYGHRQAFAALPRTRVIVKDPFAVLSLPAIVSATGALPVLLYRHPAAVLSSYRRMGWTADAEEVLAALPDAVPIPSPRLDQAGGEIPTAEIDEVALMAWFWSVLNTQALRDITGLGRGVVVAHEQAAIGGAAAMQQLFDLVDLPWDDSVAQTLRPAPDGLAAATSGSTDLHRLDRAPEAVANSWRAHVSEADLEKVERVAGPTMQALAESSVSLS